MAAIVPPSTSVVANMTSNQDGEVAGGGPSTPVAATSPPEAPATPAVRKATKANIRKPNPNLNPRPPRVLFCLKLGRLNTFYWSSGGWFLGGCWVWQRNGSRQRDCRFCDFDFSKSLFRFLCHLRNITVVVGPPKACPAKHGDGNENNRS